MEEKKLVPKLRFPGFTEPWEQRKLGEVFGCLQNNTLSRDELNYKVPNVKNIHYGDILIKFDEVVDWNSADIPFINNNLDLSKYSNSLLRDGDIVFADTAEDDTVGKAIELQNVKTPYALAGLHTIPCRPLIPFGKGYMGNFLNSESYRCQLRPLMQGVKVSSISKQALKNTTIKYPLDLLEQSQIGNIFFHITTLLTLHQRKLEHLKLKKKSLLQKLFPKEGEVYPELRFPGFTDPWEQRKLGEIFKERNERSGQGELISVTVSQGVIKAADLDRDINASIDKHNYKVVKPGDVVYNTMRMWQGACGHSPYRGILSPAYTVLIPGKNTLGTLFDYYFKRIELLQIFKKYSQGMTSDTWNLKFDILKQVKLPFPSVEEQGKIVQLFSSCDANITLHQRKLEHLQLLKKALLQQLFV